MIKDRVKADLLTAMKAQEKGRVSALRLIQAAFKKKEIDSMKELDDASAVGMLQTMIKQRKESIDQFEKGNRPDLIAKEKEEISYIEAYMPKQLSAEELDEMVTAAIKEVGATSMKDMGAVIKIVMAKAAGRVEGGPVSALVKSKLS